MNGTDPLSQYLIGVASGLTAELVKAAVGRALSKGSATKETIKAELEETARMHGATVNADNLIDVLVKNKFLNITDSKFYAADSITFSAEAAGYSLNNVDSRTDHTVVHTGKEGVISVPKGGSIVQGPPGRPGDLEISSPGEIHLTF